MAVSVTQRSPYSNAVHGPNSLHLLGLEMQPTVSDGGIQTFQVASVSHRFASNALGFEHELSFRTPTKIFSTSE